MTAKKKTTSHPAPDQTPPAARPSPTPAPEDDQFSRISPFYDELMASVPYSDWVDYIEQVMGAYKFAPTDLLDVACGTGTVAIKLAQRGYRVVGTDVSEPMLQVARRKAAQLGLDIPFHQQDAAKLKLPQKFDLAICLYDSFNYILQEKQLLAAFRAVRRALRPGGAFFFDMNSLHSFQAELFTQQSEPGEVPGYRWTSQFDPLTMLAEVEMYFEPPQGEPFTIYQHQRAYLVEEIAELLEKAGLEIVQLFDAYSLLPPGRCSERIFYLAQRPARKT